MTFRELLDGAEILTQSGNPAISGVEYDSRRVEPGDVFVAMHGETSDGNRFIENAIAAGAVAVVSDSTTEKPREGVAWAQVAHGRRGLARLSGNFYKHPARRIALTGITGTNGKSTTAFLLECIMSAAGRKSALIGTIEYHVAGNIGALRIEYWSTPPALSSTPTGLSLATVAPVSTPPLSRKEFPSFKTVVVSNVPLLSLSIWTVVLFCDALMNNAVYLKSWLVKS